MEHIEPTANNKVPLSIKVEPSLFEAVERLAREDDRSLSNMAERLLKTSPMVQEILNADAKATAQV